MLTKDLLLCRLRNGRVEPCFLSTDSSEYLDIASRLLAVYQDSIGLVRSDVEEMTAPILAECSSNKVAHGLLKVVEDRATFTSPQDLDYPACRRELFAAAAALIREHAGQTEEHYQQRLAEATKGNPLSGQKNLYADLPENDVLAKMDFLTPRQILERYNCGLVQGFLMYADDLQVTVSDSDPAKLRRLFKYLKFFRLLATISIPKKATVTDGVSDELTIHIDGPASMFEQSKRYGFQLACFFPAICALTHWKMRTELEWKESKRFLVLDETSGLVSHYHNFTAYVPEEIQLFHRYFKETVSAWKIVGNTPYLTMKGGETAFPDFSFEHETGRIIHLELFHRWHSRQVLPRLDWLEAHADIPLIIGIDRFLMKDAAVAERVSSSGWFEKRGFLFSDYPTVDKTVRCLERAMAELWKTG